MPELPEVESLRRALEPRLQGRLLKHVEVRQHRLRYPVNRSALKRRLPGRRVVALRRRAKYLLFDLDDGQVLMIHLGMSGRLALVPQATAFKRHDHVSFTLNQGQHLRFNDARRFGLVDLIAAGRESRHKLLSHLGVEPLSPAFTGQAMHTLSRGRTAPVKAFIMDARNVVGVGNIYASEALFVAGIHPRRAAGRIARQRWQTLAGAVRQVLTDAIHQGGTTLRDFLNFGGEPGGYGERLRVYGQEGEPCCRCHRSLRRLVQSGRSTFYCPGCQV
jgi:formamidopyrimidine-DNA glycosylase